MMRPRAHRKHGQRASHLRCDPAHQPFVDGIADHADRIAGEVLRREAIDDVAAAIGLKSVEGLFLSHASGNHHVLAVTRDAPDQFTPRADLVERVARRHEGATVGAVRRIDAGEVHGRIFTPAHGLLEDPAVGGGAPTIARIMHDHFAGAERCLIRQGEQIGRPSRMEVLLRPAGPKVGGPVRKAAEGVLLIG